MLTNNNFIDSLGKELQRFAPLLRKEFGYLLGAKEIFSQPFSSFKGVEFIDEMDNDTIEVSWLGITFKMQLFLCLDSSNKLKGRVLCLQRHLIYGVNVTNELGSFTFNKHGETDFPADDNDNSVNISTGATMIILHFLRLAFIANNTISLSQSETKAL